MSWKYSINLSPEPQNYKQIITLEIIVFEENGAITETVWEEYWYATVQCLWLPVT